MIAKGNIVIKAVDGLKIDIKDVNQQSVSQTIDSMVKADPQLAWLKEAEARGDVDWRLVKEIHESFKYNNSGLGPASQMIIAIVMAAVVGPAALTALSGMGTFWAATFAAVATGAATNATTSFINNGGNLGAVFADVTSSDALQGYVISGLTAGLMSEYLTKLTGVKFDANGKYAGTSLATWEGVSKFAGSQILQGGTSALITKVVGGDADIGDLLQTALFNTVAAFSFNLVGDLTQGVVDDGSATKVIIHAAVGGFLSEMTGGDFATGALAAGANEALVVELDKKVGGNKDLLSMASQIVGVLAASAIGNADADTLKTGAWIAENATKYNYDLHMPPGLTGYAQASTSMVEYMALHGATAEEIAQAQLALNQGQGFEGVQPANEFVKAWGAFMAGEISGLAFVGLIGKAGLWFAKTELGVSTKPGEAFFWSGRTGDVGGADIAQQIAMQQGGTTLEALIAQRGIQMPAWDASNPTVVQAWQNISAEYASGVSGTVRAVIGQNLRPGNVWETAELPALLKNPKVDKIVTIDPVTRLEKTIFVRGDL